jgi:hypothetical protein
MPLIDGLQHTGERILTAGRGYPLVDEQGDVISGIGVSGGLIERGQEDCLVRMWRLVFETEFIAPLAPKMGQK